MSAVSLWLKKYWKYLVFGAAGVVVIGAGVFVYSAYTADPFDGNHCLPNSKRVDVDSLSRYYICEDYKWKEYVQNSDSSHEGGSPDWSALLEGPVTLDKPVIYLYPEEQQEVLVQLDYQGELIADYPVYDTTIGGWEVVANPDGTLINKADGKEYSYLFWEGKPQRANYDLSRGFVVKGEDTVAFLQEKLSEMGLTPREYNEFIVYRYPQMKDNAYNFITFAGEEYTQTAPLKITPTPDSVLRVFMVYKPLDEYVEVQPQILESFQRIGFSVIERGGTKIK